MRHMPSRPTSAAPRRLCPADDTAGREIGAIDTNFEIPQFAFGQQYSNPLRLTLISVMPWPTSVSSSSSRHGTFFSRIDAQVRNKNHNRLLFASNGWRKTGYTTARGIVRGASRERQGVYPGPSGSRNLWATRLRYETIYAPFTSEHLRHARLRGHLFPRPPRRRNPSPARRSSSTAP